jgi:hypothetical protein
MLPATGADLIGVRGRGMGEFAIAVDFLAPASPAKRQRSQRLHPHPEASQPVAIPQQWPSSLNLVDGQDPRASEHAAWYTTAPISKPSPDKHSPSGPADHTRHRGARINHSGSAAQHSGLMDRCLSPADR